jgi:hypothetical protein
MRRGARPSKEVRASLGRESAPKTSFRTGFPAQPPALSKSAGLAISLLHSLEGTGLHPITMGREQGRTDVPRARRPVRSEATTKVHFGSSRASHRRQAIPDRLSFCRQEAELLFSLSDRLFVWVGGWICVICVICGQVRVGGRAWCFGGETERTPFTTIDRRRGLRSARGPCRDVS